MKPVAFSFSKTLRRFFEPLSKHPYLTLIITALVVAMLRIALADFVKRNSDHVLILSADAFVEATEPTSKAGPKIADECRDSSEMVQKYVEHMEAKSLSLIVRVLYPEYSPGKQLETVRLALEGVPDDEEVARKVMWNAGEQINESSEIWEKFSGREPIWFKSEKLPDWLLEDVNNALTHSHQLVNELLDHPTLENSLAACQANRKTILLLFLARLGYDDEGRIKQFLNDVKKARDCKRSLAATMEDGRNKVALLAWADSEDFRVHILNALLAKKMGEARRQLRDAIDTALEQKPHHSFDSIR